MRFQNYCGLALTVGLLVGCGGSGPDRPEIPELVKVSGKVMYNSKPLAAARVEFISEKWSDMAITGPQGQFKMPKGVQPGNNKVVISKKEGEELDMELNPDEGMDMAQLEAAGDIGGQQGPKETLPKIYSDREETTLSISVPEEGTDKADFDLTGT